MGGARVLEDRYAKLAPKADLFPCFLASASCCISRYVLPARGSKEMVHAMTLCPVCVWLPARARDQR